jgi:hypothetical protein
MKGTLISIFVGALAGVLLTVASGVHASHAAASSAKHVSIDLITPAQVESGTASGSAVAPAPPSEQSPLQR